MKRHFVEFSSPGTFFHETTIKPIDSWSTDQAVAMAGQIAERYGARPFAFQFLTRSRGPDDLDSKVTERSDFYYLGGRVMTLEDVEREMPDERILIDNMRGNKTKRVVVNNNSWRSINAMNEGDVVLDVTLPPLPKEETA